MILVPLLVACVIDRTGQSATDQMHRELADHGRRVRELEVVSEDMSRRVGQMEEVTRARGQEEILKMETMEQLRQEVAHIRGDFEVLQHDYGTYEQAGVGFQQDSDFRMSYTESRVAALEKSLGMKTPPAPVRDPSTGAVTGADPLATVDPSGTPTGTPTVTPTPEPPVTSTPEEIFALIGKNLEEGNGGVARAVAKRFIQDNPKSDRVAEAYYRIAESWQNEADYKTAAAAFQLVADKYPESTWAPWSVLRVGECFAALGDKATAKLFWADVIQRYPKSKAAKEAKAQQGK
ncbi:MAG: tetratricopeptide repeat protein [Pseudomonadota bacterium]|nr:tetratricopeptide repeat protein [Pseudomonadota bacterium]